MEEYNFIDWIRLNEQYDLVEKNILLLWEVISFDSSEKSLSSALSKAVGIEKDWFRIVFSAVRKAGMSGGDAFDLTAEVISDILIELRPESGSKLSSYLDSVKTPDEMRNLIYTASYRRAQKKVETIKRTRRKTGTVNMSALSKDEMPDFGKEDPELEMKSHCQRYNDVKSRVECELQSNIDQAKNERTRRRASLALQVFKVRISRAPEMVPLGELLDIFSGDGYPKIGKSTMFYILKDIEKTTMKVFNDLGIRKAM